MPIDFTIYNISCLLKYQLMRIWLLFTLVVSVLSECIPDTGCCFNNTCLDCNTCVCEAAGGFPLENGVTCDENRCACFECAPLVTPSPVVSPTPIPASTPTLCPTPVPCPPPHCPPEECPTPTPIACPPIPDCPSDFPPLPLLGLLLIPCLCIALAFAVAAGRRRNQIVSASVTNSNQVSVPLVRR